MLLLFTFFLVVFFFSSHNSLNGLTMFQKIPLRPGFILAINSNSIRKNDNIVVYNVTVNDTFSVAKETRMFDLIPTQYAKCPTMLNAHCCFVVVVCFVLFWWFGGCTIGYFFIL